MKPAKTNWSSVVELQRRADFGLARLLLQTQSSGRESRRRRPRWCRALSRSLATRYKDYVYRTVVHPFHASAADSVEQVLRQVDLRRARRL